VYVTVDEFKGRRPIVRGDLSLTVTPQDFHRHAAASHLSARTGGSRGEGVAVPVDLAWVRDRAVHLPVAFNALGWGASRVAVWGVPGAAAMIRMLEYAAGGMRPERWFSPVSPGSPGLHPRYRWSARMMRWASLATGAALPAPEHVPAEDPSPVLDWTGAVLAAGGRPYLHTIASAAVRLAEAALAQGRTLEGVRLTMGSEPITAARLRTVRGAGAEALPRYATVEAGPIAFGCAAPEGADDVHVLGELHAVVQPGVELGSGVQAVTLLVTSLRPTATLVLLNLSLGDAAMLRERRCDCPLDRPGWRRHLLGVRSAEKLTAAGMALLDSDVVTVLEEALPRRFGGGPADYQLIEDEGPDGQPRLRLLVHPRVGPLDPGSVVDAFLAGIGQDSGARRVGALTWRGARLLQVERRPPVTTGAGKILHLHATS
jgi:hypothetical protein